MHNGQDSFSLSINFSMSDIEPAALALNSLNDSSILLNFGTLGADRLFPSNANLIFSGAGNDIIDDNISGGGKRLYSGSGDDQLIVGTSGERLFGGSGDDELNATDGSNNRLFGGEGNDILFAGSNDLLFAGEGNDILFAGSGGSFLLGGEGIDQFWIAQAAIPESLNTVADFQVRIDKIGVGLTEEVKQFSDLTLEENSQGTLIKLGEEQLALLLEVDANELSAADFILEGGDDITPPSITVALLNDTGSSNSDGLTSDPSVNGSVADVSTITSLRAGFNQTAEADFVEVVGDLQPDGSFSFDQAQIETINGEALTEGSQTLKLIATDSAGNISEVEELNFTLDTTVPAIAVELSNDTGADSSDSITSDPSVSGTVTDASTITSFRAGFNETAEANFVEVVGDLQPDGSFSFDQAQIETINGGALTEGSQTLKLIATDSAGNISAVEELNFSLDTTGPTVTTAPFGMLDETFSSVTVSFSEAVTENGFALASYSLLDSNNNPIAITSVESVSEDTARLN